MQMRLQSLPGRPYPGLYSKWKSEEFGLQLSPIIKFYEGNLFSSINFVRNHWVVQHRQQYLLGWGQPGCLQWSNLLSVQAYIFVRGQEVQPVPYSDPNVAGSPNDHNLHHDIEICEVWQQQFAQNDRQTYENSIWLGCQIWKSSVRRIWWGVADRMHQNQITPVGSQRQRIERINKNQCPSYRLQYVKSQGTYSTDQIGEYGFSKNGRWSHWPNWGRHWII